LPDYNKIDTLPNGITERGSVINMVKTETHIRKFIPTWQYTPCVCTAKTNRSMAERTVVFSSVLTIRVFRYVTLCRRVSCSWRFQWLRCHPTSSTRKTSTKNSCVLSESNETHNYTVWTKFCILLH